MGMFDRQREMFSELHRQLQTLFPADDPMKGAFVGTQSKTFSKQQFALAASEHLLAVQAVDRKLQLTGELLWLRHTDIVSSSAWGDGGSWRDKLSVEADYQIRFATADQKFKIEAWGGWTMAKMMGDDYIAGMEAVAEWLSHRPS